MPVERLVFRAVRKDDFLDLTFELVNVHVEGAPPVLARTVPDEPVLLIVQFPPQHVVEEAFGPGQPAPNPGTPPARAMLAEGSRLVFRFPDAESTWPLTLTTLLNWRAYEPVLAPNALPPSATTGPGPAPPTNEQTALEIPTGLYLSPDAAGMWAHQIDPVTRGGRTELWHTRLVQRAPELETGMREDGELFARVVWNRAPTVPFLTPFGNDPDAQRVRGDIVRLSSDFTMPAVPPQFAGSQLRMAFWRWLLAQRGLPRRYVPRPARVRRLMLSAAGAWADLESAWDYPLIIPGQNSDLGYDKLTLEQWKHVATQGRDAYVRIVQTCFLCDPGHLASLVTVTERQFTPLLVRTEQTPQGRVSIFGATAFLRQEQHIEVQQPFKDYAALGASYVHAGREMPFRSLRITTLATPPLDNASQSQVFWPQVNGRPFHFQLLGEDWERKTTSFERQLLCVPLAAVTNAGAWKTIVAAYNTAEASRRTAQIGGPVAFAQTGASSLGKTTLHTDEVESVAQLVNGERIGRLPPSHPLFLPTIATADVRLPAVQSLLGRADTVPITFDPVYLAHGMDPTVNKGEVFAQLVGALALPFASEKAGGLVKPDTSIRGVSRSLGPVANPASAQKGTFDTTAFDKARFLGAITLGSILKKNTTFDPAAVADLPVTEQQFHAPGFRLPVPVLTNSELAAPAAIETRFIWKPDIIPLTIGILTFETQVDGRPPATLALQARIVTPLDGTAGTSEVDGRLTDFALSFAKALKITFDSLRFRGESGRKMDVSAKGVDVSFEGPLKFVNTLKDVFPADSFGGGPSLEVTASGIRAGYTLALPTVGVGIFSLENIGLSASLSLPFVDKPAGVRFSVSERQKPFLVTVSLFGGGGFFSIALNTQGIEQIEAAIEFGGNICLNLGVASGGVTVMAGIYFSLTGSEVKLTGYLRVAGYVEVLGLITISIEFYLGFTYRSKEGDKGEVWGQASVSVSVKIACFSKSVTLTVERKFAGAAGDPTFADLVEPEDWDAYCLAFA